MIVCVLFPHFAATVAEMQHPYLEGQPIIIGGYPWQRKAVYAAALPARRLGVEPGMTLSKAWLLCPNAQFLPAEESQYLTAFEHIVDTLQHFTHRLEPDADVQASPACYLDVGNLKASDLEKLIAQMQAALAPYRPSISIASNKFTARVAAALGEVAHVQAGDEAQFLAAIALKRLKLSQQLARRFHLLGIRTLGDLAQLPASSIMTQFGADGLRLYELAHGRDDRPLQPRQPEATRHASHQADEPITDRVTLENILGQMAQEISAALQTDELACRQLTLHVITEDYTRHSTVVDLRQPLSTCENLLEQLMIMLGRLPLQCGVLDLLVSATHLKTITLQQLPLFPKIAEEAALLENVANHLHRRHQATCIFRVKLTEEESPLLERRYQVERLGA